MVYSLCSKKLSASETDNVHVQQVRSLRSTSHDVNNLHYVLVTLTFDLMVVCGSAISFAILKEKGRYVDIYIYIARLLWAHV